MVNKNTDWDKLFERVEEFTVDELEFIFNEAKDNLCALIEVYDSFRSRALTTLTFLIPTILALLGYLVSNEDIVNLVSFYPTVCAITLLTLASFFCLRIINSKHSYFKGITPSNLLECDWKKDETDVHKQLLFSQCKSYEDRIKQRTQQNNAAGENLKYVVYLMFFTPIASIALLVIAYFLVPLF